MTGYTWFILVWDLISTGYYCHAWKIRNGDNIPNTVESLKRFYLLAVCRSASDLTKKEAKKLAEKHVAPLIESKAEELGEYVCRENCKIVAVTDEKLAEAIYNNAEGDFEVVIGRKV